MVRIVIIDEAVNVFCTPSGGPKEASLSKGVLSSSPGGRLGGQHVIIDDASDNSVVDVDHFPCIFAGSFLAWHARFMHIYDGPGTIFMPLPPNACPWHHIHAPGNIFMPLAPYSCPMQMARGIPPKWAQQGTPCS